MEEFNVSKYFRDKLFEQEDQLEPKDDDVDSAFTKGEKEEEEQEEIRNPDYEEDLADIKKAMARIVMSGNAKVSSILPLKPLLSIIEDQFDDPNSQIQNIIKEGDYNEGSSVVKFVLGILPSIVTEILFFEYILPDKPDDKLIEPILGELATYFNIDVDELAGEYRGGDAVKYYKYQNKKIKSGDYDNIRFDKQSGEFFRVK